ncbi:hypothetical protein SCP_0105420 [Sparassis crispa]|uniref:Uncharacterized protein n=1 Tax=Sparassis crispa TaxID=139825 RepID=A0A401G670_9APHY|nr:hypothetical protein SCP_0105420 [Sparassis crispa]GBE77661.1 hypothetical protein SCP_0105420 [Sparassis crispa]
MQAWSQRWESTRLILTLKLIHPGTNLRTGWQKIDVMVDDGSSAHSASTRLERVKLLAKVRHDAEKQQKRRKD